MVTGYRLLMRSAIGIVAPYVIAEGLKTVLQPLFEQTELLTYDSAEALRAEAESKKGSRPYFVHFFIMADMIGANADFFLACPQLTMLLDDGKNLPDKRFPTLNIVCTEEEWYRQILALRQSDHQNSLSQVQKVESLSERETDVLRCVAKGMINKEIANELCISVATVITHRTHITEKLGMKSVAALTVYAVVHGVVNYNEIII